MTIDGWRGEGGARHREDENARLRPPFRQGRLDALCGIYAILNAFAYARRTVPIRHFPNRKLFSKLVAQNTKHTGSTRFMTKGISYDEMKALTNLAVSYYEKRGYRFQARKPKSLFGGLPRPSWDTRPEERLAWFRQAAPIANAAVILDIQAPWIWHWSVFAGVEGDRLLLYDSFGMRSIAVEHVAGWRAVYVE